MTLPNGGQIAASQINAEFGRGGQMGMFEARNGYYGAINDASGPRPGGPSRNTNSGYAYSDWWGYQHNAQYSPIYLYIIENSADADVRVRRYWFNGDWVCKNWTNFLITETSSFFGNSPDFFKHTFITNKYQGKNVSSLFLLTFSMLEQ